MTSHSGQGGNPLFTLSYIFLRSACITALVVTCLYRIGNFPQAGETTFILVTFFAVLVCESLIPGRNT